MSTYKRWTLAGLVTVFAMELYTPAPADACGVKLTVKSGAPRKAVARSSNPSQVLLLGRPPRRLERDLAAAGHKVDVAPSASTAKKKQYAVVIADADMQNEARTNFNGSVVLVRSNDPVTDIRSVENQVARRPVSARTGGTVVAAREDRRPIAAGPTDDPARRPIAGREPGEAAKPVTPPPTPRVAVRPEPKPVEEPKPDPKPPVEPPVAAVEPKPVKPAPEPKPSRPAAVARATSSEVYFSVNDADAGARAAAAIAKAAKWMTDNASINVTIEGHADPTGLPETNMALSQRRAEWVRDQLIAAGIDGSRIEVVAHGDTKLKYGAADARNRRVAIVPKP